MFFLVYETKFTAGKSQEVVFTARKRRGRWGRGRGATWSRGSIDPHFFRCGVHNGAWPLTCAQSVPV